MEAEGEFGNMLFTSHSNLMSHLREHDRVVIKATIGVVIDHDDHYQPPPPPPAKSLASSSSSFEEKLCILFQVGDQCYYEHESLITARCPALLSDQSLSNHIVVISDVDADVFEAVLWFLNHNILDPEDAEAIANSKDSFDVKMLAAADKFKLKDLRRQCQSFAYFGDSLTNFS